MANTPNNIFTGKGNGHKIPTPFIIGLLIICVMPFILMQLGLDFGTSGIKLDYSELLQKSGHDALEAQFQALSGAFIHSLLEWSAFCIAAITVFLALSHYKITHNATTPIIGVAFFMAGCMDAFHTLAADRLIDAVADNRDFIPFTWAVSRSFNALIMIIGVGILFLFKRENKEKSDFRFIIGISLLLGGAAYIIIHISANTVLLPQTTFPDAFLTRPYDALPLLLFLFAGLVVYPKLYKHYPSLFVHALMISTMPHVITQLHMTFGSTALYDSHFNVAHFMKLVAYTVPLIGLTLDYIRAPQLLKIEISQRKKAQVALENSELYQNSILKNIVDGLITIDDKGTVKSFNPAAVKIFGYQPEEVIGNNIKCLMPDPYHSEHDGYLNNYHQTSERKIIGIGREVSGLRKDGSIFPMDLAVSEMTVNDQKIYTGIMRDITERKQMDKMKNEFISTVSHELRTPLTSIRGSLGLIVGGAVGALPQQAEEMLKIATNNTERLLLLINDILDIQKIESGQMAFKFKKLEIMPFLEQSLIDNEAYGNQYKVKFVNIQKLPNTHVYADNDRLMQVIANLLSNAAKFSPENDIVEISVAIHHGDSVRISVTDHGPGIPEEFQPKLFDKFTQSDSSDTKQKGGTGLGLSISKVIIEKHGGRIDFISREGIGTTFYIELPILMGEKITDENDHPRRLPYQHLPCILIIEDDLDVAALLQRMLVEAGYNSDIAYDAEEARKLLHKKPGQYKAITLDLILPGEDGMSLLQYLREDKTTKNIPVVVVSVKANETKRELNGGAVGVSDWLSKPIDHDRLLNAVIQAAGPSHFPRVLHVEDEADVHKVVNAMLRDHCDLTWTTTLAASKEALEMENFDLVLLDIGLPDGSGLDLIETIERRVTPPRVVIFSAYEVTEKYAAKVSAVLMKSKTSNIKLAKVIKGLIKCNPLTNGGKDKKD